MHFHDQFACMPSQFDCGIKKLTPEGIGIYRYWNNRRCDIFLEGLEQVITDQHQKAPCCISIEFLERQLFMAKVFQCLVGQFIITPWMVRTKDTVSLGTVFFTGLSELIINSISHTYVRDDNAVRAQAEQTKLSIAFNQSAVDGSTSILLGPPVSP